MLEHIYNETVTILNKLRRADAGGNTDLWYKTILYNVAWYTDSARSAGGSAVYIGTYNTILIPFNDKYLPYMEWKTKANRGEYFTISNSDYIVRGIVSEEINANNVVAVMQKYGEDICLVKHHNENHNRFGAKVQLKIQGV
jgi:hypothetical protein